eukprot:gene43979-59565_t
MAAKPDTTPTASQKSNDDSAMIRELALLLDETNLTEIEVERAGLPLSRAHRQPAMRPSMPATALSIARSRASARGADRRSAVLVEGASTQRRDRKIRMIRKTVLAVLATAAVALAAPTAASARGGFGGHGGFHGSGFHGGWHGGGWRGPGFGATMPAPVETAA